MESENVKERLTSMLHKKRSDQQDRENKEAESSEFPKIIKQEKEESNISQETLSDASLSNNNDDYYQEPAITLQEILDEKKRVLLHDPNVIKFLLNKK